MKGRAVYGVDTGAALLIGSILAGVSVFLFVLRQGGFSSVPAGKAGTLWIGGAALSAILALGCRSRIEIDFEKGRWKTTRGVWPFWTLREGPLSEVGGLALTYSGVRTGPIWTVELERSETSYQVGRFYDEGPARACWERTADELGAPAWDRTEDPPRYRERMSAASAPVAPVALERESAANLGAPPSHVLVSEDPRAERTLLPSEPFPAAGPPPRHVLVSGHPGTERILLPIEPLRTVGALAVFVVELLWVRPFPPRPFFGWPIGVSTAALAAAMLVVPSVIALCRCRITESAEYIRIGYTLLGVEWGMVELRKAAVAEVAIHGTPKRASFFSPDRELLVRTNETGVRLGGELDASGLGWLEDAVRTMIARRR